MNLQKQLNRISSLWSYRTDNDKLGTDQVLKYSSPIVFNSLKNSLDGGNNTSMVLIGDSTANGIDEWFYLFVLYLLNKYTNFDIKYHLWNVTTQNYDQPIYLRGANTTRYLTLTTAGAFIYQSEMEVPNITGDIDIRCFVRATDYSNGANQILVAKYNADKSYRFQLAADGRLYFEWTADGTTMLTATMAGTLYEVSSSVDNTDIWLRVTLDVNNEAGGNDTKFYYSYDGITWTQKGVTRTLAGTTSIFSSAANIEIGARSGTAEVFNGRIYHVEIRNGIDGEIVSPILIDSWRRSSASVVYNGTDTPILSVFNGSHPGATTAYLSDAARMKTLLPHGAHSSIILNTGHNDVSYVDPAISNIITVSSYINLFSTWITAINTRNKIAEVIITTQNPKALLGSVTALDIKRQLQFSGGILALARKSGVSVIDTLSFLKTYDIKDITATDGVHPTPIGSQRESQLIYNVFLA